MGNFFRSDDLGKLTLRLTVGTLMLFHGAAKLGNVGTLDFIKGQLVNTGLPDVIAYGVYIGEIVAPMMIILGVYARYGGLIIVVTMLFAITLVHMDDLLGLSKHGGWALELQGFYLLCGLTVILLGSGRFAIKPD